MNSVIPSLVRVQDRLTLGSEAAVWRINPRTGFLESRAGLSWTGVRKYRTPQGLLRVLRRPEQVNSPGHLRTLRRLPCCDGHPDGGLDVLSTNVDTLGVGWAGDGLAIEEVRGYARPVGDVTVSRLITIAKMLDPQTWEQYSEMFPEVVKGVRHDGSAARTGTSLGYNALWYGPYIDAEIVSERDDGALVGEWQGPKGPEQYDIEHIVDPDCEVVQRLVTNAGFKPELLGGNHFAVALQALGGRGAEQSELMRVVDSVELPITGDLARRMTRVALQVPRMPDATQTRDADWTVGASRDLPIVPGDWDGDKAAASVFAWAGFDDDKPDPAKARQAFLIYDADAPELKGAYKLPIAEHRDGGLRVVKGGIDAAASYLPQTDAPEEVLGRARDVLDHYYTQWEEQQGAAAARDALPQREIKMNKKTIEIGLGRDAVKALAKLNKQAPNALSLTLDEIDADKLMSKLGEMQEMFGDLIEMVGMAKAEAKEMEDKYDGAMSEMKDMMSVAEAEKKIEELKTQLGEAEKMLGEAKAAEGEMAKAADEAKAARDALEAELAPHREAALQGFRDSVVAAGFDKDAIAACKTEGAIKRHVVVTKLGDRYSKARDDGSYALGDETVAAAFDGLWSTLGKPVPATPPAAPSQTFAGFPQLTLQRDAGDKPNNKPAPVNTVAQMKAGMGCLG